MWRSTLLLALLAGCSMFRGALSQSVGDCTATVQIVGTTSTNQIDIPLGTVCVECVVDEEVVTDPAPSFLIGNSPITSLDGGVLVVDDTSMTFRASPSLTLRCVSGSGDVRQASVYLDVYLPPIITGETTVNEGGTLFLTCDSTNSNREPRAQWFDKDGQVVSPSGLLNILNITRSQAGSYTCRTSPPNDDNSTSTTVTVVVQFAPDVTADREDLVLVPVGIGTLRISCTYLGIPPPTTVTWIHNGTALDPAADSRISVSFNDTRTTLIITEVTEEEGGMYVCVPQNVVGNNSATTEVRIQLPPGPPTALGIVGDSETTISLGISWTNPVFSGFSPIDGFTVILTSRHPDIVRDIPGDATTMTANLDSLRPFTAYTIRLSVMNAVELEGEAAVTTGMTDSLILDRVGGLVAVAVNSTAISVTWTEPVIEPDTTSPVEMYRIMFSSPSEGSTETLTVPASETSVVLTGLEMGTDYSITVVGLNSAGPGASDSEDVETDIDPPSVPQNFNGTSDNPFIIFVFWEQPETDGGRPIVRYDLTLTAIGGGPDAETVLANSNLEFTFSGLRQDTGYRVVVTAVNRDGGSTGPERTSDPVEIMITTLAVGPPQTPDTPTISMVTNTSARISWTDPGGFPDNYTLQVKPTLADWTSGEVVTIPDITILYNDRNDLMPLTTYDARVLSVNFNGPSNYSDDGDDSRFSTVGMVMIGGGEGAVNDTLETTSGDTVTLTCSLDQVDSAPVTGPVTFIWARQDGRPLPEGSTQANGVLTIPGASVEDSGVYVCSSSGVQGSFTLSVVDDESGGTKVSTTIIIIVVVVVVVALLVLLVAVVIAVYCLCFRDGGKVGNSPHKRTFSFRAKHWTDSSGSHSMPREQQSRKDLVQSFHMPDDYTTTTSFDTTDRVRRSPSPPSFSKNTHAGAEPTTSFQLQGDNTVL